MKRLFSEPLIPEVPQEPVAQAQEALDLARQLAQHPTVQEIFQKNQKQAKRRERGEQSVWTANSGEVDRPADIPAPKTPNEGTKGLDTTMAFLQKTWDLEIRTEPVPKPTGVAFQEALATHQLWGQYPAYLRPRSPDQMHDINLLRKAQSWQRRKELLPPLNENHPKRVADLPEEERPSIYRAVKCQTCQDQKNICRGWLDKYRRHIVPCPDCVVKEKERRKRETINRHWGIDKQNLKLAKMPWIDNRMGAVGGNRARAAQQQIIKEMPSQKTWFLYGVASVGKSRLLAEIAVVARERGLSSILKTAKRIKEIIQNFPLQDDPPLLRAKKQRLLSRARENLKNVDVLIIDELDDVTGRYFQGELLEILNHRLGHGLTTCFGANSRKYELRNKSGHVVSVNYTLDFLSDPIRERLMAKGALHINMCEDKPIRKYIGI